MGPSMLIVLAAGAALAGLTFSQVVAWDPVWTAWVAANFESPGVRDALGYLPFGIFAAQILTVLATAMPRAVALRL